MAIGAPSCRLPVPRQQGLVSGPGRTSTCLSVPLGAHTAENTDLPPSLWLLAASVSCDGPRGLTTLCLPRGSPGAWPCLGESRLARCRSGSGGQKRGPGVPPTDLAVTYCDCLMQGRPRPRP